MLSATERIRVLLETLDDARNAWHTGSGGGGVIQMPSMYHLGSYKELEVQMQRMRDFRETKPYWLQINLRYRWGTISWLEVPVERHNGNPSYRLPERSELRIVGEHSNHKAWVQVYQWADVVKPKQVEAGLALLKRLMYKGRYDRICLPPEVRNTPVAVIHSHA